MTEKGWGQFTFRPATAPVARNRWNCHMAIFAMWICPLCLY